MNKLFKSLVVVLLISSSLFAKVIESKKMEEILSSVTADSLVIFDLDNTIMSAAQTLGSDQWFDHRIVQYKEKGLDTDAAVTATKVEWDAINRKGEVQLVESVTPEIIRSIQDRGIPTMGLTARPVSFEDKSLSQLHQLGVQLDRITVSTSVVTIHDKDVAEFRDGLMSVGGNNKGTLLLKLLDSVDFRPGRIIFVDDKAKNTKNVDDALIAASIPSFAYRYGAADAAVAAYDAKLADFELAYFQENGIVLSDAQARKLMN